MNLHPMLNDYDTVEWRGRKPCGNFQSCVDYQVCFGTGGVVWCKSGVDERVQDPGSAFNMGGEQDGGEGGKMGYI